MPSSNLALPYLEPAQAQKHVTVNEALLRLDALVQLSVVSATVSAQPTAPTDGAVYILPAGKTGAAWGGMANNALAYYVDGAWQQITPREGWLAWAQDTNQLLVHDGSAWSQAAVRAGLGLGTAATQNTGTSGAVVPLLNGANAWGVQQSFQAGLDVANAAGFFIRGPAGSDRGFYFGTNSSNRWVAYATGQSETGSNAGSNMEIAAFSDAGGYLRSQMFFNRATGEATFGGALKPAADAAYALGSASARWSQVYAATGTINTSDAREKTALAPVPDSLRRAIRAVLGQIGVFQWREAVAQKGAAHARLHLGVTAQAVKAAFAAEGEDPRRYALFCEDQVFERVEVEPARVLQSTELDPETGEERLVERVVPPRFEERPALDEVGRPLTRLGVRTDQLMWLALAVLAPAQTA